MTLELEIDKGPFSKSYRHSPQIIVPSVSKSTLEELIGLLEFFCTTSDILCDNDLPRIDEIKNTDQYCSLNHSLTSAGIQQFLEVSTVLENNPFYHFATGILVSKLIQNAHNSGISEFTFTMHGLKPFDWFGAGLRRKSPLDIIVYGQIGSWGFYHSSCNVLVQSTDAIFARSSVGQYATAEMRNQDHYLLTGFYPAEYHISPIGDDERSIYYTKDSPSEHYITHYNPPRGRCFLTPSFRLYQYFNDYHVNYPDNHLSYSKNTVQLISQKRWCTMWKPAEKVFAKMDQLFGGQR